MPSVRALQPSEAEAAIPALAEVLVDCVAGGASVGFMDGLTQAEAAAFYAGCAAAAAKDERVIFVAEDRQGVCGTVQLVPAAMPNQPHRADISKMLVHRRARRSGAGTALLQAAEAGARARGFTVLVLDTVTGSDASRVYERQGWIRSGEIPDYALSPDGSFCATTVYYRQL